MSKFIPLVVLLLFCQQGILCQEQDSIAIEKHPVLTDRYSIKAGFFSNSKSVILNVDGNLPSRPIDFGKTLGLRREEGTLDLSFDWRFSKNKKWTFGFEFFRVRNSQTAVLQDKVKWNNTIYAVGVILDTGFDIDMYRIFFGRLISIGEKHEFGAGIGLHTMNISSFAQATGYVGDIDIELDTNKRKVEALAPVPNIGFHYLYAPNLRWAIKANVEWFSLSIGDYSGTLWNLEPAVSFQIFDHLGIGVGYKYFNAKVDMNKNIWKGTADLLYQGPLFSIRGNF